MTRVLAGARRNGKTSELIRMAAKEGLYIVTSTKQCAQRIAAQAHRMGINNLLYPVTCREVCDLRHTPYDTHKGRVLVDNADIVLALLLNMPIEAMTVTTSVQADISLTDMCEGCVHCHVGADWDTCETCARNWSDKYEVAQ